jgi:hypothetical protein
MTVVPFVRPETFPFVPAEFEIVATACVAEDHETLAERSWVVLSENVPVAVSSVDVPSASDGAGGVMAIESRMAFVTVSVAVSLTAPTAAVMTLVPMATPVASPFEPVALEIVAVAAVIDDHAAVSVRSCLLASVKKPVAMNCSFVPAAIVCVAGVTTIETSVSAVTMRVSFPVTTTAAAPVPIVEVAEMTDMPTAAPVASPFEPAAFETVTAAIAEDQVTFVVRSCVVESV